MGVNFYLNCLVVTFLSHEVPIYFKMLGLIVEHEIFRGPFVALIVAQIVVGFSSRNPSSLISLLRHVALHVVLTLALYSDSRDDLELGILFFLSTMRLGFDPS